jgi:hypothetical protein
VIGLRESQGARRSHMGKHPPRIFILGSFMLIDNQFTNTTSAGARGSWASGRKTVVVAVDPERIQHGSNLPVTTVSFVLPGDAPGL